MDVEPALAIGTDPGESGVIGKRHAQRRFAQWDTGMGVGVWRSLGVDLVDDGQPLLADVGARDRLRQWSASAAMAALGRVRVPRPGR